MTLVYFLLAITILVAFHEWGHFTVARLCGVKVVRFSIGFGKRLISWRDKKGTEFVIAWLPLGGFVKMIDDEKEVLNQEEEKQAFRNKSPWQRLAIVFAGPFYNFIFAIFALALMFMLGIYTLSPIIGSVKPDSIAYKAGLKSLDEIKAIDKRTINSWRDFQLLMTSYIGTNETVPVLVKSVTDKKERAILLNLHHWNLDLSKPDIIKSLGIKIFIPKIAPVVGEVIKDMPADKAGLQKGDRILRVNGKPIDDWFEVVSFVRNAKQQSINLEVSRNGVKKQIHVRPVLKQNGKEKISFIGVHAKKNELPKAWLKLQRYTPIIAFKKGVTETMRLSYLTIELAYKLISGSVSPRAISGPIGIAQGAHRSAESGLAYFLAFLAMVSVSLGVLNLLPIPILDGGQLLFIIFEMIMGHPISERSRQISMTIGFIALFILMIFALSNDLLRIISAN